MTHNRAARRAAESSFKDMMRQAWDSNWTERDPVLEAKVKGIEHLKPPGIKRFVHNTRYSVQLYHHQTEWGEVVQLLIRRHDSKPVRSWVDMQRIKDELIGPDRTAIEVFPAAKDLVDQANCYHLWVLPEGFDLPFGLHFAGWSK